MLGKKQKRNKGFAHYPWADYCEALQPLAEDLSAYGEQKSGWFSVFGFGQRNRLRVTQETVLGEPRDKVEAQVARYEKRNGLFRAVQRLFTPIKKKQSLLCYDRLTIELTTLRQLDNPSKLAVARHATRMKMLCKGPLSRLTGQLTWHTDTLTKQKLGILSPRWLFVFRLS